MVDLISVDLLFVLGRLGMRLPFEICVKKSKHSYAGLMRSVIYFMRSVSYSMMLVSEYLLTAIGRCGRLGTRVDLELESIETL